MGTFDASVSWWARCEPERTAVIYDGQRISYSELERRSQAVAGLLRSRGVAPGDVVALLMKNSSAFVELVLGAVRAGAVVLPINYRLGAEEVDYILEHSGARLIFADEEFRQTAGSRAPAIYLDGASQADASRLASGTEPLLVAYPSGPDDLFRLMYTSGTTDRPKGVMHTYSNVTWKCFDHIAALGITRDERLLVVGPLYHVGAFDLPGLAVLLMGGMLAILREFEPRAALEMIERERLSGGWMAPVMLNRSLALEGRERFDLSSFRWLIGGGERTPAERIREFGSLFRHARYVDAYGLTESCAADTFMEAGRELEKIGSVGRPVAHVDLQIRNDAGEPVAAGQTGEVCLRGPKVTHGYWKDPAKTAASFFGGGWFRTGDVGYLDDEGFLYLTDRMKDMIISGGENIASSEVERVLYQLPQVAEAAAIGLPDERWGERVTAVVALVPGSTLTQAELRAHCEGRLGGFKTPKELIILEALPRNPSGKVLKRVLREQLATHPGEKT